MDTLYAVAALVLTGGFALFYGCLARVIARTATGREWWLAGLSLAASLFFTVLFVSIVADLI